MRKGKGNHRIFFFFLRSSFQIDVSYYSINYMVCLTCRPFNNVSDVGFSLGKDVSSGDVFLLLNSLFPSGLKEFHEYFVCGFFLSIIFKSPIYKSKDPCKNSELSTGGISYIIIIII